MEKFLIHPKIEFTANIQRKPQLILHKNSNIKYMGLIGLLIAAVIIILFFVFTNSSFLSSNSSSYNYKNIQNKAQDVMDSATEKSKLEQKVIEDLKLP